MRLSGHLSDARTGKDKPLSCWIREEISAGFTPELRVVAECKGSGVTEEGAETLRLRLAGNSLLNRGRASHGLTKRHETQDVAIWMPPALVAKLDKLADKARRSRSLMVMLIVEEYVDREFPKLDASGN